MKIFNPNEPGMANGNYFALPYTIGESEVVIVSVPWDVTTSYRSGTHKGPSSIMDASLQVDLYDPMVPDAWSVKIGSVPAQDTIEKKNKRFRKIAEQVISHIEEGGELSEIDDLLAEVNIASEELNELVYKSCREQLEAGKISAVVGGDHSVPLGNMRAVADKYDDFGVLHIDAHADLRAAYEGFKYSHASILYNALSEIAQISQLTQVGVRDFCQEEAEFINTDPRIRCFTDMELKRNAFEGKNWKKQCEDIVSSLPVNVYITVDIDGLSPDLCPNTGTPVPGGITFREVDYLLYLLAISNRRIIGFDLCEVAPGKSDEWDANVGARVLYKLCIYSSLNSKKQII